MSPVLIVTYIAFSVLEVFVLMRFKQDDRTLFFKNGLFTYVAFMVITLAARLIFDFDIPDFVLVLAMVVLASHNYLGFYRSFYLRYRVFDRCQHLVGSFTTALLSFSLLIGLVQAGGSRLFQSIFVFTLGMSLCALFEIVEYMTDVKHSSHMQRGLKDTNWDLICDAFGSLIAAIGVGWLNFIRL